MLNLNMKSSQIGIRCSGTNKCFQRHQIDHFCQGFFSAIQPLEIPFQIPLELSFEMPFEIPPEIPFEIPPEIPLEIPFEILLEISIEIRPEIHLEIPF